MISLTNMVIISFYYFHLSVIYWLSIVDKELYLGLMGYMDMMLAFKSLQNLKEIKYRGVIQIQVPWGNLLALYIMYKAQREQKSRK